MKTADQLLTDLLRKRRISADEHHEIVTAINSEKKGVFNKEEGKFTIYQNSTHTFDFMQRLKILFGKKLRTEGVIVVDMEVNVIKGNVVGIIEDFSFLKKSGEVEQPDVTPMSDYSQ